MIIKMAVVRLRPFCSWNMGFLLLALIFVPMIEGAEQMTVLHSPKSLTFNSGESLRLSQLPDVLSAVWDFTALKDEKWSGLNSGNPFKRPEGIVVVEVEGLQSLDVDMKGNKFALETDVEPGWSFELIADRTFVRFAEKNPFLLEIINDDSIYNVKSQYSGLLSKLPARPSELEDRVLDEQSVLEGRAPSALNLSLTPDMKFLLDVQLVLETARIVKDKTTLVRDGIPDLYWFRIPGLQELLTVYPVDSPQIKEAMQIATKVLNEVKNLFVKAYDGNVLVLLLGVNYQSGGIRFGRSLLQAETTLAPPDIGKDFNIATPYNSDYPVAFNIIFLSTLIFFLSVFAISLGIWHMDPGRDSIIYRITSQRMKKDQ